MIALLLESKNLHLGVDLLELWIVSDLKIRYHTINISLEILTYPKRKDKWIFELLKRLSLI